MEAAQAERVEVSVPLDRQAAQGLAEAQQEGWRALWGWGSMRSVATPISF